ncbi:hypothetical protein [Porphyromonas macacae]|uniref:hypothetical protein n=1 Tax=Porphyromonas macacae TaxID=28115 RepID=UPI0011C02150|nr:hypothetical protein [Porphyromonas macacae]
MCRNRTFHNQFSKKNIFLSILAWRYFSLSPNVNISIYPETREKQTYFSPFYYFPQVLENIPNKELRSEEKKQKEDCPQAYPKQDDNPLEITISTGVCGDKW